MAGVSTSFRPVTCSLAFLVDICSNEKGIPTLAKQTRGTNVSRLPSAFPDGVFLNLAATCETISEAG